MTNETNFLILISCLFHIIGLQFTRTKIGINLSFSHAWKCSKFILTSAQPSETFSISMEIFRQNSFIFLFQVVGRGKRNFFEGVMVFFFNDYFSCGDPVEMELFSRKLSSIDNEEIWFPIFSLFDCIKVLISLTLNCETISIRHLILFKV